MVPAPLFVVTAALCTQSGQAVGKFLFGRIDPSGVLALRLGIAAAVLLVIFRPVRLPRTRRDRTLVAGLGVAVAGMNLIYPALWYLPLGIAGTIQLLGPLSVALAGSRRLPDLLVVGAVAASLWLMRDPGAGALAWQGLVLAGLSAVAMAAYLLISRALASALGHSGLACGLVVAAGLGVPAGLSSNGLDMFRPSALLIGVVVALLSAVIPYSLEMAALTRLPASTVAVLLCLEPVVAAGAGLIVLDETLSVQRWAGIGGICAAAAAATVRGARQTPARHGDPS